MKFTVPKNIHIETFRFENAFSLLKASKKQNDGESRKKLQSAKKQKKVWSCKWPKRIQ